MALTTIQISILHEPNVNGSGYIQSGTNKGQFENKFEETEMVYLGFLTVFLKTRFSQIGKGKLTTD